MNYGLIYLIKWPILVEIIEILKHPSICVFFCIFLNESLNVWIICVTCVHSCIPSCQMSFLCILEVTYICLDANFDEWGCVQVNEWMNELFAI